MRQQQYFWYAGLGTVVALILAATLHPVGAEAPARVNPLCLLCGDRSAADAVLNVGLFVPLGIVLALGIAGWPALVIPACLSAVIELVQLAIPGRHTLLADLLANSAGGALGVMAVRLAPRWLLPAAAPASRLALGWSVAAAGLLLGTGWSLQPSWPDSVYYGQWTARLAHLSAYQGTVLDARVGGMAVPGHRVADSRGLRALLEAGAPIEVSFLAGPAPDGLAPLFSLFDDRQREILLVGARRETFVIRYRSRAAALRFQNPALQERQALAGVTPGDTVRLTLWHSSEPAAICARAPRVFTACPLAHTPGRGWALLRGLPAEAGPVDMRPGLDFLWVALLGIPLGFWLRGTLRGVAGVLLFLGAVALVPSLFPLVRFSLAALAGGAFGVAAGHGLRRAVEKARQPLAGSRARAPTARASSSRQRSIRL